MVEVLENSHLHLTNHREALAIALLTCWHLRTEPEVGMDRGLSFLWYCNPTPLSMACRHSLPQASLRLSSESFSVGNLSFLLETLESKVGPAMHTLPTSLD